MPVYNAEFNKVVRYVGSLVPHSLTQGDYKDFAALCSDYEHTGRIKINVNNSDGTLFGDAATNWLFRAWHDMCHIKANADFSETGEGTAATYMKQTILPLLPNTTPVQLAEFERIIDCEVCGQGAYFSAYGEFPLDQYAFSMYYLKYGAIPPKQELKP